MIQELWSRIGGPHVIRLSVWFAMAPISVIGFFLAFFRDIPEGAEASLVAVSLVSYLPHGAVLGLAWLTYLSSYSKRRARPKLTLATFLIAGFSTGIMFAVLLDSTGLYENPDYIGFAITRALISLYWSILLVVVFDSVGRFAANSKELSEAIHVATEVAKSRMIAVDALRLELITKVKSTIEHALNVKNRFELDQAADQIVRPLVDSLRSRGIVVADKSQLKPQKISVWPTVVDAITAPSAPVLVSLFAAVANLIANMRWLASMTLLNIGTVFLIMSATFYLIRELKPKSGWLAIVYCIGIGFSIGSGEFFQLFAPDTAREFSNLNLGAWLVAVFVGSFLKFEARSSEIIQNLRMTLEEIQWNQNRLDQELWVERLRLTRYVHGNIQSKIRAAASRSGDLTPAQLQKLKDECLSMLDVEISPVSFGDFVEQTRRVWDGIVNIELVADPELLKVLEADSFATVSVIETVREGVLNAVRHGQAKNACLTMDLTEAKSGQSLNLRLENDGHPISPDVSSGFGSTVLNDSTANWELENFSGGVVLKAAIPVNSHSIVS